VGMVGARIGARLGGLFSGSGADISSPTASDCRPHGWISGVVGWVYDAEGIRLPFLFAEPALLSRYLLGLRDRFR